VLRDMSERDKLTIAKPAFIINFPYIFHFLYGASNEEKQAIPSDNSFGSFFSGLCPGKP
jgi:hypothetical protein